MASFFRIDVIETDAGEQRAVRFVAEHPAVQLIIIHRALRDFSAPGSGFSTGGVPILFVKGSGCLELGCFVEGHVAELRRGHRSGVWLERSGLGCGVSPRRLSGRSRRVKPGPLAPRQRRGTSRV